MMRDFGCDCEPQALMSQIDLKTGNPTKQKLIELGLDFAIEDIG